MQYKTVRFGIVDVPTEQLIIFPQGLPGFGELREFFWVPVPENSCFVWLQSADVPEIAFLVTDPFIFHPQYEIHLSPAEQELIKARQPEEVLVYVIVRIPANGKTQDITANFVAPVVVNTTSRLGCQVVLEGTNYQVREPLFKDNYTNPGCEGAAKCLF